LKDQLMRQINPLTITRPHVTVDALVQLSTYLTETGYSQLAFPVLLLQEYLTRPCILSQANLSCASSTSNLLVRLKLMELCCYLNLENGIAHHQGFLGNLGPNEDEIAKALIDEASQSGRKVCSRLTTSWLEIAERLIQLSQGTSARQYLELAERFGTGQLHQRRLLFAKAKLALVEGQYGLSRNFLAELSVSSTRVKLCEVVLVLIVVKA
uniref:FAT domain-containing protein n=1 Tax=Echinostoma caproni TaxID=27848 RepID=A0A183B9W9_9TREM